MQAFLHRYREALIWTAVLLAAGFGIHPDAAGPSLCFFRWVGLESCPGCGIGHSIHAALHGQFREAWQYHYMGIPAVLIICGRIVSLVITQKQPIHEQLPDGPPRSAT